MRGLAGLASRFILTLFVRMGRNLGEQDNKQQCQGESQESIQALLGLPPTNHFDLHLAPVYV